MYDVTTNVANYDIQSAKSEDPDQMPHYAESHLGSYSLYYVPFMGHSAKSPQIVQAPVRRHNVTCIKNGFRHKHKISSFFCAVLFSCCCYFSKL